MINQKPISARIKFERLKELEQEAFISGVSKNEIINRAIELYFHFMDARRRAIMYDNWEDWEKICATLALTRYRLR